MKSRWAQETVRAGLRRASAAWFLMPDTAIGEELRCTFAVCVYHALGRTTTEELAALDTPGAYAEWFAASPDLLPAVVAFRDTATGAEHCHRYEWLGWPTSGSTALYTKVERAGRHTGPWPEWRLFRLKPHAVATIESWLDRSPIVPGAPRLIRRHDPAYAAALIDTKLARFCVAVATRAASHLHRPWS